MHLVLCLFGVKLASFKKTLRFSLFTLFQGLEKLCVLFDKHGNALDLLAIGVVFGYLPILTFCAPHILQPATIADLVDNIKNISIIITFLAISANFGTMVFT